jgi:hypothetical protein
MASRTLSAAAARTEQPAAFVKSHGKLYDDREVFMFKIHSLFCVNLALTA